MGYTEEVLGEVQDEIRAADDVLAEARRRRDQVLDAAMKFDGALRRFSSGSIAHGTANKPKKSNGELAQMDADCGVALDRRTYPELGPDGDNEPPNETVEKMRQHLRDELRDEFPDAAFRVTKRAITVTFNQPMADGSDPTVDLIVALTRQAGALWIPNCEDECWDASDPEGHTQMLTDGSVRLRRVRARIVRLAKAWNTNYSKPGVCSFNLEALALDYVTEDMSVSEGLAGFFEFAADELEDHLTPDPAQVSDDIKLLLDQEVVVGRFRRAAEKMRYALDHDDEEDEVRDALADLFPGQLSPPDASMSKAGIAARLRDGNERLAVSRGTAVLPGTAPSIQARTTRSWGRAAP